MAFGIDDALAAAIGGLKLIETLAEIVERYRESKMDTQFELLLLEVTSTALARISQADLALAQLERTLVERKIDLDMRLSEIIRSISIWHAWEQHRLSQIQEHFHQLSDSIYSAIGDVAALARCQQQTKELGVAVVNSFEEKHAFEEKMLYASVKEQIGLLRDKLSQLRSKLTG